MKFGYTEECGLTKARQEGRRYTDEDHKGQCNCTCCPSCGKWLAGRLKRDHGHKGRAISDTTREVLLTWNTIPVHSDWTNGLVRFVLAIRQLNTWLDNVAVGRRWVDAFVGGSEFNAPGKGADGKMQCHVHIACLPRAGQWLRFFRSLKKVWIEFGGRSVKPDPRRGTIKGIMNYLSKDPIKNFSKKGRADLHERLFRRAEDALAASPVIRLFGGPALSGPGYQKLRARAAAERGTLRDQMRDINSKALGYLPSVREVCPVFVCPDCKGTLNRNGKTSAGTQRWRCKKCGLSRTRLPSPYRIRCVPGSRISISQARAIYRMYYERGSMSAVVRITGFTRYTVQKAVRYFGPHSPHRRSEAERKGVVQAPGRLPRGQPR